MSETKEQFFAPLVPLLQADPHRWGMGLVHQIDPDRDQLMCGKTPANCPGDRFDGRAWQITCKSCLRSIEARVRYEQMREENARREEQRAFYQREWWQRYNAYLLSPAWHTKRKRVMLRANGLCEGCGERPAAHVHHLRYPQQCFAGSPEWAAQEKLFDLRAVCVRCHEEIHGGRP